jgi:WD40 repeat protein
MILVTGGHTGIWQLSTGERRTSFLGHSAPTFWSEVVPDGQRALTLAMNGEARLWRVDSGELLQNFQLVPSQFGPGAFAGSQNLLVVPCEDGAVRAIDLGTGTPIRRYETRLIVDRESPHLAEHAVMSPDHKALLTSFQADKSIHLWDTGTGRLRQRIRMDAEGLTGIQVSPDGRFALLETSDGIPCLIDLSTGVMRGRFYAFQNDGWAFVGQDGRFDTNSLEDVHAIYWMAADSPYQPLPLDIFMRDYFQPQLLRSIWQNEGLPAIRDLSQLNRTRPQFKNLAVRTAAGGTVAVTVTVAGNTESFQRGGVAVPVSTGVYDLRLFRNGQIVGRWPPLDDDHAAEPSPTSPEQMETWRRAYGIPLNPDQGTATRTFTIRLPHYDRPTPVAISAYAFNEDRVRSETARIEYVAESSAASHRPRAYLVAMGVSASEHPDWNLRFAAADARLMAEAVGQALQTAGRYDVVSVLLVSEVEDGQNPTATRENLRATLQLLAGREISPEQRQRLPNGERVSRATPDDLVLISFSGHGYTDAAGRLHLLPYDVGHGREDINQILPRCISSGDLAAWCRDVDAGEVVLVLDACHSAAAGAPPGFKPGPLGSRGLAQLAYDKGMRVLAASQADDVALESERIRQGLLTYALVRDGLEGRRASRGGKLTLGGALAYAADRVPGLFEEVLRGEVVDALGRQVVPISPDDGTSRRIQRPELFNYAQRRPDIELGLQVKND